MAVASGDCSLDRVRASPCFAFHANDGRLYDRAFGDIFVPAATRDVRAVAILAQINPAMHP
jgi:hypothetical protein